MKGFPGADLEKVIGIEKEVVVCQGTEEDPEIVIEDSKKRGEIAVDDIEVE